MITWIGIGAVTGLLLGLTGAGGAILSVPLFIHLNGASLSEATLQSLLPVFAGAALGWLAQRSASQTRLALSLAAASALGSYLFAPLKPITPDWLVRGLFVALCSLSLASLWRPKKGSAKNSQSMNLTQRPPEASSTHDPSSVAPTQTMDPPLLSTTLAGVTLGGLVTLTGLGGGVLLIPLLSGPFQLSLPAATATSLLTVSLSALSSLILQGMRRPLPLDASQALALFLGSVASALVTRELIRRVPETQLNSIRKTLVSVVIVGSLAALFLKA